jgi:hypothetical protein
MKCTISVICLSILTVLCCSATTVRAQGLVPGTGTHIDYVGDTFEDTEWEFVQRPGKSSKENDEQTRSPLGYSKNRRWFEGPERGYPDLLKVIPTPEGGLPGSEYALLMRTLHSGVPGRITRGVQHLRPSSGKTDQARTSVFVLGCPPRSENRRKVSSVWVGPRWSRNPIGRACGFTSVAKRIAT